MYGDNDNLSAIIATLVGADALVIFTDTDGLYSANPREDSCAQRIPVVETITPEILALAGERGSKRGTGGMVTKLQAAKTATQAGIHTVVLSGATPENLYRLLEGESVGTFFAGQKDG